MTRWCNPVYHTVSIEMGIGNLFIKKVNMQTPVSNIRGGRSEGSPTKKNIRGHGMEKSLL